MNAHGVSGDVDVGQVEIQHTATHCNTLQPPPHTSTHCNILQHPATHCNILQHTATHCNTLQLNTPHRNTLQHTATHCDTPFVFFKNLKVSWSCEDGDVGQMRFLSLLGIFCKRALKLVALFAERDLQLVGQMKISQKSSRYRVAKTHRMP